MNDVVVSLVCASLHPVPDIGSDETVKILDMARMSMRALGMSDDAYTVTGQFRIGDIRYACADISAAIMRLDWSPQVSIQSGVQQLAAEREPNSKRQRNKGVFFGKR